jgi:hypothetical protein
MMHDAAQAAARCRHAGRTYRRQTGNSARSRSTRAKAEAPALARQFGISQSNVRKALASDKPKP